MMDDRMISGDLQGEDLQVEQSLRPQILRQYIGQEKTKRNLKHNLLKQAKMREDHWITSCYMVLQVYGKRHWHRLLPMKWVYSFERTPGQQSERAGDLAADFIFP